MCVRAGVYVTFRGLVMFRDGLERIEIADTATVTELRRQIANKLDIPENAVVISKDQNLVSYKS